MRLWETNIDLVSHFKACYLAANLCDYACAVVSDWIWKALYHDLSFVLQCKVKLSSTYVSANTGLKAPDAFLTSMGFTLALCTLRTTSLGEDIVGFGRFDIEYLEGSEKEGVVIDCICDDILTSHEFDCCIVCTIRSTNLCLYIPYVFDRKYESLSLLLGIVNRGRFGTTIAPSSNIFFGFSWCI